jgi:hypothetical protein
LASGKKAAVRFHGAGNQACVNNIFEKIGGPQQIARDFLHRIAEKAKDFHKSSPAIYFDRARATPSCAKSFVKAKIP